MGRRPTLFESARWCGAERGKGRGRGWGVRGWRRMGGENGEERGSPVRGGGQLGRLASALGRWVQAASLPRDRGGWWGAGDSGVSG
jgi:hypothetical protein